MWRVLASFAGGALVMALILLIPSPDDQTTLKEGVAVLAGAITLVVLLGTILKPEDWPRTVAQCPKCRHHSLCSIPITALTLELGHRSHWVCHNCDYHT